MLHEFDWKHENSDWIYFIIVKIGIPYSWKHWFSEQELLVSGNWIGLLSLIGKLEK